MLLQFEELHFPFDPLQFDDDVLSGHRPIGDVDTPEFFLFGHVLREHAVGGESRLHHLAGGRSFPCRVKQPQMIEQILLQDAFLGVVVGYSLKILDGIEAGLHYIPVKRSLEGVPVRKNGQELVYVMDMRGQFFGRAPQFHALERQDAVSIHELPVLVLVDGQRTELRDQGFGAFAEAFRQGLQPFGQGR